MNDTNLVSLADAALRGRLEYSILCTAYMVSAIAGHLYIT